MEAVDVPPLSPYGKAKRAAFARRRIALIHVDDLLSSLLFAICNPAAAEKSFLCHICSVVTTQTIYRCMRQVLGLVPLSWVVPDTILRIMASTGDFFGQLTGKSLPFNRAVYDKLMQPAVYSAEKIVTELGWQPSIDLQAGINTLN